MHVCVARLAGSFGSMYCGVGWIQSDHQCTGRGVLLKSRELEGTFQESGKRPLFPRVSRETQDGWLYIL